LSVHRAAGIVPAFRMRVDLAGLAGAFGDPGTLIRVAAA